MRSDRGAAGARGGVARVVMALALVGCRNTGEAPPTAKVEPAADPAKLSAAEVEDLDYVRNSSLIGIPYKLNLADEKQHAYVQETLKRFGRTKEKSPKLFAMIEEARRGHPAGPPVVANLDSAEKAELVGINYVPTFGSEADGLFHSSAFSTYPKEKVPYSTNVLLTLFDRTNNRTISSAEKTVYGTTNVEVPVSGKPPPNVEVEANALFLIAPSEGAPLEPYSVVLTKQARMTNACQRAPNYNSGVVEQCRTNANTTCVNNSPKPRDIRICYAERVHADCDYGCPGKGIPPDIIFPIQGSADLGVQPPLPLKGSLYIVLTNAIAGGGCVLNTSNARISDIVMTGTVASWNLAPATFPNKTCLQPNGFEFNYLFQLFVQIPGGLPASVTFTSVPPPRPLPNTFIVPALRIDQGCLAEGTRIRLADGKDRPVEAFQGYGDEKVLGMDRGVRAVTQKMWGTEEKPLVSIHAEGGFALDLTEEHPVITTAGVKRAKELQVGDAVLTVEGDARLTAVARKTSPKAVPIHNLSVGTEEDAAQGSSTFFANGILVGDQQMQRNLMIEAARPRVRSAAEICATLPADWLEECSAALE